MFCPKCGAQSAGSFCTECGSSAAESVKQDGELFTQKPKVSFWKSGVVAAAAFTAIAGIVLSGFFWTSLDEAKSEERRSAAEVNRQTQEVALAEKAYLDSSKEYLDRLLCFSSSFVCNIVHGFSFTLEAANDADELVRDEARRDLAAAESELSRARGISAELERNLNYAAAGSGVSSFVLLGIRAVIFRRLTRG